VLTVALSIIVITAAGCTGSGGTTPSAGPGSTSSPGGPLTSNTHVVFKEGEYHYTFNSILASLILHGSDGTLRVQNGSGAEVGAPGLYVITGDDKRYDGQITGAAPIPNAGDVTLEVTFPTQVTAKTVGLVVLLLGPDNMGALAPVAEG
jgi:hypothetical protein